MKAIDVCAGAGGLSLGLQRAGFDVHGVDHYREAVLVHRIHVGPCDLSSIVSWHPPHAAPFVAGGVPCQAFSHQGGREGMAETVGPLFPNTPEPRAHLYLELLRIATEAKARVCMLENVRGLMTWNGGAAFETICDAFRGYGFKHLRWSLLNAADFGVAQHRERVFVVGFRFAKDAKRFAWPTPTHGPDRVLPWVSVRQALGLDGGEYRSGARKAGWWQGGRQIDVDAPGYTIGTRNNADLLVRRGPAPTPDTALDMPARTITSSTHDETVDYGNKGRRYGPILKEAIAREAASEEEILQREELIHQLDLAGIADRPSTSIVGTAGGRVARAGHKGDGDQWKGSVRLTAEQCAALQSFPEDWAWPPVLEDAHLCIGNAVPPLLGEAMGRAIFAALR